MRPTLFEALMALALLCLGALLIAPRLAQASPSVRLSQSQALQLHLTALTRAQLALAAPSLPPATSLVEHTRALLQALSPHSQALRRLLGSPLVAAPLADGTPALRLGGTFTVLFRSDTWIVQP